MFVRLDRDVSDFGEYTGHLSYVRCQSLLRQRFRIVKDGLPLKIFSVGCLVVRFCVTELNLSLRILRGMPFMSSKRSVFAPVMRNFDTLSTFPSFGLFCSNLSDSVFNGKNAIGSSLAEALLIEMFNKDGKGSPSTVLVYGWLTSLTCVGSCPVREPSERARPRDETACAPRSISEALQVFAACS